MDNRDLIPNQSIDDPMRVRILDSTVACINRWGLEKTSLSNIAKEAGVARSTIYMYYSSREEVIESAMLYSGDSFMHLLLEHVEQFSLPEERLIEALLFLIDNVTDQSLMMSVSASDPSKNTSKVTSGLMAGPGRKLAQTVIAICLKSREDLLQEIDEIADFAIGLAIYLVMTADFRTREQTIQLLKKRLMPAIGL